MKHRKFFILAWFFSLVGVPMAVTLNSLMALLLALYVGDGDSFLVFLFLLMPVIPLVFWYFTVRKANIPESASSRLAPIFAPFFYYMAVWILSFGFAGYDFYNGRFDIFTIMALPYYFVYPSLRKFCFLVFFPLIQVIALFVSIAAYRIAAARNKKTFKREKVVYRYWAAALLLCLAAGWQNYDRTTKFLSPDWLGMERISDTVSLNLYKPSFRGNNLLEILAEPEITIDGDYPKLDGASSAYPLYGAIALSIYKGLDGQTAGDYVVCTSIGYERLSDGEIDIFFGAEPSKAQVETAAARGLEFRLTPIGREAFVFFVNRDNPVDNLSVEQIRDIYRKKISNWRAVGGRNKRIMPFQRPEDSGSQAVMTIRVMEGEKLPTPLIEEHSGTILSSGPRYSVAEYRNYSSAIGYSFRFFAGGKKPNDNIKLIAIDGVEPTPANIRNGRYPFTADIYAVTTGDESANTRKLIDWILSEQGQNFVEQCGYVRR